MVKEGQVRIPSGCAIAAVISKEGKKMSGQMIYNAMKPMHDRSNGLGGGFAGYGIYPEYKDFYALHMFFDCRATRKACEAFLKERFEIVKSEIIPTRTIPAITDAPIIWRYFAAPLRSQLTSMQLDEKEFVAKTVIEINTEMNGAYAFSSGKNMGTFKAVGFPEDVGVFYKLEEYEGYSWTAHGRYPTNTPGWWGGAHPFTLTDALSKCSDINVRCRPIRRLSPILWITLSVSKVSLWVKRQASLRHRFGVPLPIKPIRKIKKNTFSCERYFRACSLPDHFLLFSVLTEGSWH